MFLGCSICRTVRPSPFSNTGLLGLFGFAFGQVTMKSHSRNVESIWAAGVFKTRDDGRVGRGGGRRDEITTKCLIWFKRETLGSGRVLKKVAVPDAAVVFPFLWMSEHCLRGKPPRRKQMGPSSAEEAPRGPGRGLGLLWVARG